MLKLAQCVLDVPHCSCVRLTSLQVTIAIGSVGSICPKGVARLQVKNLPTVATFLLLVTGKVSHRFSHMDDENLSESGIVYTEGVEIYGDGPMAIQDPTAKTPSPEEHSRGDFWQHRTLSELAEAQGVGLVEDVRIFYGTWPGEPDDGFELLVDEHRHAVPARG